MPRDTFPAGVAEQLKWYVYRLTDPRNGETAIMQLGHLGSCLTRSETGRYAFKTICRHVFEMATQYRGSRWAVTS